jgi:hypothetical protein
MLAPQNAVAFNSDANFKDLYGRFVYRFNLEKDRESRNGVQAAGRRDRAIIPICPGHLLLLWAHCNSPSAACLPMA